MAMGRLRESVDLGEGDACSAIGSAYDGSIVSCGQVKHECRFGWIWWCESIPLEVNGVRIVLPVVVDCDGSTGRVVDS